MNEPQQTMLHCCCNNKDECGTRRNNVDMAVGEVRTFVVAVITVTHRFFMFIFLMHF